MFTVVNFDESGIPISFSQPKNRSSSSLGSSSAVPSFFNLPSGEKVVVRASYFLDYII